MNKKSHTHNTPVDYVEKKLHIIPFEFRVDCIKYSQCMMKIFLLAEKKIFFYC